MTQIKTGELPAHARVRNAILARPVANRAPALDGRF